MNLNGTIKKTQALSGRLVKSSGGGGSVQEIYWVQWGVGTATNAEVNEAVAANKLPICYWDSTDAYGRPRRTLYFLIRNTPTESFFSGVDYINNAIIVRRLYADAWTTQTIRYEGRLTWDTRPRLGSQNPVTSGGIYQALQDVTVSDERIAEAVDDWLSVQAPSIGTLSYAAKRALLACFRKVAWIDNQAQSYYNALENELFPDATLESITAVFTQGSAVIYDTDSLDTLKQYLVVTATFSDSTTAIVSDYTLSGTLTAGTSAITVSYGGKTTTFNVTVTHYSGVLAQGTHTFSNGSYVTVRGNHVKVYCSEAYNGAHGYQFNFLDINDNTSVALTNTDNANNKSSKFTIPANTQCTFAINNISANGVYVKNRTGTTEGQSLVFGNRIANGTTNAGSDTVFGSNTTYTETANGYPTGSYSRNFTLSSSTDIGALYVYFGKADASGTMEFDVEYTVGGTPIV